MFARTRRLTLRHGWPEDAAALAAAIGHEPVVRNLAQVPWPYRLDDAAAFLALPRAAADATFLIFAHDAPRPRLVGGIALGPFADEPHELGYWITPDAWGRGYATEAGGAVVAIARALALPRITAGPFADNPASGAVLRKLGFTATGETRPCPARARGTPVPAIRYVLPLGRAGAERLRA